MLPPTGSVVRVLAAPVIFFVLFTSGCAVTPVTRSEQDRPVEQFCATVLVGDDIRAAAWRAARDGLVVYVAERPYTTLALSCCAKADQSARIASVDHCKT